MLLFLNIILKLHLQQLTLKKQWPYGAKLVLLKKNTYLYRCYKSAQCYVVFETSPWCPNFILFLKASSFSSFLQSSFFLSSSFTLPQKIAPQALKIMIENRNYHGLLGELHEMFPAAGKLPVR